MEVGRPEEGADEDARNQEAEVDDVVVERHGVVDVADGVSQISPGSLSLSPHLPLLFTHLESSPGRIADVQSAICQLIANRLLSSALKRNFKFPSS